MEVERNATVFPLFYNSSTILLQFPIYCKVRAKFATQNLMRSPNTGNDPRGRADVSRIGCQKTGQSRN